MIKYETIIDNLNRSIKQGKPLIGVASGSGLSAKQAAEGGADMIFALSAGRFRLAGISSIGCMLPYANANQLVMDFASKEIIPLIKDVPVIFGACATDLTYSRSELISNIKAAGFSGVNNFPTVGLIDGKFREHLEEVGLGFEREVELMKDAKAEGLFTVAFVFDEGQARMMAEADVDVICAHLGWTEGGEKGFSKAKVFREWLIWADGVFKVADSVKPGVLKMVYGGPIEYPEQAYMFYQNTDAIGYIGGSSFERIPTEIAIKDTTRKFKNYYRLKDENKRLKKELTKKKTFDKIVGQSRLMQDIYDIVNKVSDKNINILVEGESGTGKELVVRAIHQNSKRAEGPFIKVNCAALPASLLESELFGHEKGAFTGADKQRLGKFELANGGTLFLDEIGDMDLDLQAKFLRIIQEREFERLGGEKTISVDVRIVSATNIDLRKAVHAGRFREDLFYRLNVVNINTPPLREHREDIPLLVNYFLKDIEERFAMSNLKVTAPVLDAFMHHEWPGNVRELKHVLERAAVLADDEFVRLKDLPSSIGQTVKTEGASVDLIEMVSMSAGEMEKALIIKVLSENNYSRTVSAEKLGFTRKTLYNKMKKYKIETSGK